MTWWLPLLLLLACVPMVLVVVALTRYRWFVTPVPRDHGPILAYFCHVCCEEGDQHMSSWPQGVDDQADCFNRILESVMEFDPAAAGEAGEETSEYEE